MRAFICFLALLALAGCADSSAIVTGKTHPATTADKVQIFLQPPAAKYEVIGVVTASNNGRLSVTRQQKTDAAMRVLKAKAAELGANGVLLQGQGTEPGSTVGVVGNGTFVAGTYRLVTLSGTAIFIP